MNNLLSDSPSDSRDQELPDGYIPPDAFLRLKAELQKVIVGQEYLIERLMIALLSDGHVLLEGVPGLAKTKTLMALTTSIHAQMNRVQFTPDLLPSDLIGTEVYRPQSGEFILRKGPLFTNLLLADEINRAPAKVQSALLQAMQERQVSIGEQTLSLPSPFLVLATQNPIEQEGTYSLPEAQLDRFLMKLQVGYPSFEDELEILRLTSKDDGLSQIKPCLSLNDLSTMSRASRSLYVDPRIDKYIVTLVQASRSPENFGLKGMIDWGASPRASIALKSCARSLSYLRGGTFVTPDEVKDVAQDVLRHRILVSFEAEARGITSGTVIDKLLSQVTVP